MCGINGIYNISKLNSPLQEMEKMIAKQKHRGPDASGTYVNDFIAFGHSRYRLLIQILLLISHFIVQTTSLYSSLMVKFTTIKK